MDRWPGRIKMFRMNNRDGRVIPRSMDIRRHRIISAGMDNSNDKGKAPRMNSGARRISNEGMDK